MLFELPYRFVVSVRRSELNTLDVNEIADWLGSNLTGDVAIMNFTNEPKISLGLPGKESLDFTSDALFMFENYNDALHFKMRFLG